MLAKPLGEQLPVALVELAEPLVAELFGPPGALVRLALELELVVALFELAPRILYKIRTLLILVEILI